jgi:beta-glucosidase
MGKTGMMQFSIKASLIAFVLASLCLGAVQYSGFVKTKDGTDVPAAQVSVMGSTLHTVTDAQGAFTLPGLVFNAIPAFENKIASINVRLTGSSIILLGDRVNRNRIVVYDMRGRRLAVAENTGKSVMLSLGNITGMLAVTASSGLASKVFQVMAMDGKCCSHQEYGIALPPQPKSLAKTMATDSVPPDEVKYLIATKPGYFRGGTPVQGTIASNILITLIDSASYDGLMPYQNPALPPDVRAKNIVSLMSRSEKLLQMTNNGAAIARLGVKAYNWWNESCHGLEHHEYGATCFPHAIGLAAMWDTDMMHGVATAISEEGRATYHKMLDSKGSTGQHQGIDFFGPNINIFRDPRWGRGQETYGEDPYLTARTAVAYVKGMQGDDPVYLRAGSTAKHFAAFSGPGNSYNVNTVSESDLRQTYLPAFRVAVKEANVAAIMCAFNRPNSSIYCCQNPYLLRTILRSQWGFTGYVVADCEAIYQISAGTDLVCTGSSVDGTTSDALLDTALWRTFEKRFRLGMFDPPEMVPYNRTPFTVVNSPFHDTLAAQACRKAVVLLKNQSNLLPLSSKSLKIAVIGPHANQPEFYWGSYYWIAPYTVTIYQGIKKVFPAATFTQGCAVVNSDTGGFAAAEAAAKAADVVVFAGGITSSFYPSQYSSFPQLETEGIDRGNLNLPAVQEQLLKSLHATGKPVVLVMINGSPMTLDWENANIEAIIEAWYPGQEAGTALADIISGDYNPAGRLPITFYKSLAQVPDINDYDMTKGRTYRYLKTRPAYSFGFGLSYTTFAYSNLSVLPASPTTIDTLKVSATVRNSGTRDGEEVVQLYTTDVGTPASVPQRQLNGFKRIRIAAGQQTTVSFLVTPYQLSYINTGNNRVIDPGAFNISVGGCQPDSNAAAGAVLSTSVTMGGSTQQFAP